MYIYIYTCSPQKRRFMMDRGASSESRHGSPHISGPKKTLLRLRTRGNACNYSDTARNLKVYKKGTTHDNTYCMLFVMRVYSP